MAGAASNMYIL